MDPLLQNPLSHIRLVALTAVAVVLPIVVPTASVSAEPAAPTWRVSMVAGIGEPGYSGDGGPAVEARLGGSSAYGPRIAVAKDGTLYVAEWANHRMRRVTPNGMIDTVPGSRTVRGGNPRAVAIAGDGTAYLAIWTGIRRIGAGGASEIPIDNSGLLSDIAVDRAENIYYADNSFDDNGRRRSRGTTTNTQFSSEYAIYLSTGQRR